MNCPQCGHDKDKVVESRVKRGGWTMYRRRQCLKCGHRTTTFEEIDRQVWTAKKRGRDHAPDEDAKLEQLAKELERLRVEVDHLRASLVRMRKGRERDRKIFFSRNGRAARAGIIQKIERAIFEKYQDAFGGMSKQELAGISHAYDKGEENGN